MALGWTYKIDKRSGVNVMTWNNKKAKVDIREWDEKHEKM